VLGPFAPRESDSKGNNDASIKKEHENTEHSQEYGFPLIWLRLTKQPKCSDPNGKTNTARQNVKCRPPFNRFPVEAASQTG